ncbi:carbohydrate kinase family protein [Brachybacterium hainanense]|uniref:Carbohydrate kinase family protein n=1 Tax=Brachybacterium hainanense TaxID=1541174 RepID=A0ABV6R8E3_9MICO
MTNPAPSGSGRPTAGPPLPSRPPVTGTSVDLLAVGQLFLDVLYGPLPAAPVLGQECFTEQVRLVPGGIANFAAAAAALGARTGITARIGDGPVSALVTRLLAEAGIGTERLLVDSGTDLQVTSAISYDGDRALVTGGAPPRPGLGVDGSDPGVGAIALHLEPGDMPWLASSTAPIFADVGWDATGAWDPAILRHLQHCHGFLPNAEEAQAYTRTDSPRAAARRLAELVPLAVVTCGADGALAIDSARGLEVRSRVPDLGPMDPTGAGDTFGAALITLLGRGLPLAEALEASCLAATARGAGTFGHAVTPSPSQLAALARRHDLACAAPLEDLLVDPPSPSTSAPPGS